MSDTKLATIQQDGMAAMEAVIAKGDLSKLTPDERVQYYAATCRSMGLNPLTQPFQYLNLQGKTVLYAGRTATDQLRKIHGVSIEVVSKERIEDVYVVTVKAWTPDGRQDTEIGAVAIGNAKGEQLANVLMKAETKAKRRATMSICGLGWMDETEVETVREARPLQVDVETGEIIEDAPGSLSGTDYGRYSAAIEAAKTLADLKAVADDIARLGLSTLDPARKKLTGEYNARKAELSRPQPELIELEVAADPDRHTA